MSQVAHQAGAYPSISTPPWMGCWSFSGLTTLSIKFAGTHLHTCTWVERGTVLPNNIQYV